MGGMMAHTGYPDFQAMPLYPGGPLAETVVCADCGRPYNAPCGDGEFVQGLRGEWVQVDAPVVDERRGPQSP
jgi:hypothetical protein